jgi:hypothetical protein
MSLKKCGACRNYIPGRDTGQRYLGCRRGYWSAPAGWDFNKEIADKRARGAVSSCEDYKMHKVGKRSYWM